MMSYGLGLWGRANPGEAVQPVLFTAPHVSGNATETASLVSDETDTWRCGPATATAVEREYRLLIDTVPMVGPQTSATVVIPDGTGGRNYSFEIRARISEGGGAQSAWTQIATGTVVQALSLNQTATGEMELDGTTGTVTITITSPAAYANFGAGVFAFDSADLASGPVNLVPPQIIDDGTPADGEELAITPGLWVYDPDNGNLGAASYQWQADTARNGTFADLSGATSSHYTLTLPESGDDVRVQETLTDNGGSRTATSEVISVASGVEFTDTFDQPNGIDLSTLSDYTLIDGGAGEATTNGLGEWVVPADGNGRVQYLLYTGTLADDQFAEIVLGSDNGEDWWTTPRVLLRATDVDNYYEIRRQTTSRIRLFTRISGTLTEIAVADGITIPTGARIRAEVQGNQITVLVNGSVVIGPVADDSFASGSAGFGLNSTVQAVADVSLSEFKCGDL